MCSNRRTSTLLRILTKLTDLRVAVLYGSPPILFILHTHPRHLEPKGMAVLWEGRSHSPGSGRSCRGMTGLVRCRRLANAMGIKVATADTVHRHGRVMTAKG